MKLEDEILISAYLDGEVSSDEKLRAEQLLTASAEARQLAEELRIVRTRLQDLPRFGLPADFADQTLRRAEQELKAARAIDSATGVSTGGTSSPDRQPERSASPPGSIWTTWRGFAWAAVALAAGLMIWITNLPPANQQVELAKNQPVTTTGQRPQVAAAKTEAGNEIQSVPPQTAPSPATVDTPAPGQIVSDSGKNNTLSPTTDGYGGMPNLSTQAGHRSSQAVPQSRTLAGNANALSATGGGQGGMNRAGADQRLDAFEAANGKVLVVYVDIAADAAQRGEFDMLLANHQIEFSEASTSRSEKATRGAASDAIQEPQQSQAKQQFDREPPPEVLGTLADALQHRDSGPADASKPEAAGHLDVVYVEASPEQLDETLRALNTAHNAFLSVSVANFLPLKESGAVLEKSKLEPSPPPAPAPENTPSNPAATELLAPKPSEKDQTADESKPSASSTAETNQLRFGGRATRLTLPIESPVATKKIDGAPADRAAKSPSDSADKTEVQPANKSISDGTSKARIEQPARQRALFVLRTVAPSPPAAAQPVESEAAPPRK